MVPTAVYPVTIMTSTTQVEVAVKNRVGVAAEFTSPDHDRTHLNLAYGNAEATSRVTSEPNLHAWLEHGALLHPDGYAFHMGVGMMSELKGVGCDRFVFGLDHEDYYDNDTRDSIALMIGAAASSAAFAGSSL